MEGVVRWPVVADELKDLRTKLWLGFRQYQHNKDLFKVLWSYIKRVVVSEWAQHTGRFIRSEIDVHNYRLRLGPCHCQMRDNVERCDNIFDISVCDASMRNCICAYKNKRYRSWYWVDKRGVALVRY